MEFSGSRSTQSTETRIDAESKPDDPCSLKTPERGRNRGVALSIKDIRRAAQLLHKSDPDPKPNETKSVWRPTTNRQRLSIPKSKVAVESGSNVKLPEKFEKLCETFDSLQNVVLMSRNRGTGRLSTAFSNIRPIVEDSIDRKFTYEHLAQMKFILPDTIILKKVVPFDERTSCYKLDLLINFEVDKRTTCKKNDRKVKGGRWSLQLGKIFRARLLNFFISNPEATEIPEGPLPEPFGRPSEGASVNTFEPATPYKLTTSTDRNEGYLDKTYAKSASIPATPVIATPAPLTPKRPQMSPDDNFSTGSKNLAKRTFLRPRSLQFESPVKNLVDEDGGMAIIDDNELVDILGPDLFQLIMKKKLKAKEENDDGPAISQAKRQIGGESSHFTRK